MVLEEILHVNMNRRLAQRQALVRGGGSRYKQRERPEREIVRQRREERERERREQREMQDHLRVLRRQRDRIVADQERNRALQRMMEETKMVKPRPGESVHTAGFEKFAQLFERDLNAIISPDHELSAVDESVEKTNALRSFLNRNFALFFSRDQAERFIDRLQPSSWLEDNYPFNVEVIDQLKDEIKDRIRS